MKKEVYELLSREQKEKQRAFSPIKTCVKLMMGIILLAVAYGIGCGILSSELGIKRMFRMTAIYVFVEYSVHSFSFRAWHIYLIGYAENFQGKSSGHLHAVSCRKRYF